MKKKQKTGIRGLRCCSTLLAWHGFPTGRALPGEGKSLFSFKFSWLRYGWQGPDMRLFDKTNIYGAPKDAALM